VFSGVERPHTDEFTFFSCHAEAEGVTAKSSVESIDGRDMTRTLPPAVEVVLQSAFVNVASRFHHRRRSLQGWEIPWDGRGPDWEGPGRACPR